MDVDNERQLLPTEICEEILTFEAAKPLVRSSLVSREWKNLINSERFKKKHKAKQVKMGNLLPYYSEQQIYRPLFYSWMFGRSPPMLRLTWEEEERVDMLCSCHGLVCYTSTHDDFYLCNLTNGRRLKVPSCMIEFPQPVWTARVFFGLGYVDDADDYKLVRIAIFVGEGFESRVDVFSRNKMCWTFEGGFPFNHPMEGPGVYVAGRLHWLISAGGAERYIGVLNVGNMLYGKIDIANLEFQEACSLRIDNLNDNVLVVYDIYRGGDGGFRVWLLHMYGVESSWKCYDIVLPSAIVDLYECISIQPIKFNDKHKTEILFRIDPKGTYGVYNIVTKTFKENETGARAFVGHHIMFKYIESLENPMSEWQLE